MRHPSDADTMRLDDGAESVESAVTFVPPDSTHVSAAARGSGAGGAAATEHRPMLARRETRAVLWLKGVVIAVLIVAAVIIAVVAYRISYAGEVEHFESSFQDDAQRLKTEYYYQSSQLTWVSISLTIRYLVQGAFQSDLLHVTMFDFDVAGSPLLHLSRAESISCGPVLTNTTKEQWEQYASNNQFWTDPLMAAPPPKDVRRVDEGIWELNDQLVAVNDTSPSDDIIAPIWQTTPLSLRRKMLLHNAYSEKVRRHSIDVLLRTKVPLISGILQDATEAQLQTNYSSAPTSIAMSPIVNVLGGNDVIGILYIEFRWCAIFATLLQTNTPIHAVVENTCNDLFTLEVSGPQVKYVGSGDHHDHRFDSYMVTTSESELLDWFDDRERVIPPAPGYDKYLKVDTVRERRDEDECRYVVRLYPTQDYENVYKTNRPMYMAIGVVMIFVFTIFVFAMYDFLVERRQSLVMDTALPSINIVNQLYPPAFIDRIIQPSVYRDDDPQKDRNSRVRRSITHHGINPMQSLHDFLTNSSCDAALKMSRPIAELFPDVTVMFADISGFTAWSSEREPTQVFQLLEVLFAAFDDVGKKLGVFKVETIGDCYVGVLGLPAPFQAHAVVMCRFAQAIHKCMSELTKRLEVQLGPGTSDLQLRIGLHSGPVTAGVLRGEKSRFQLFGDTMNTAARMESTGEPGKIHVSKKTCDFLIASGKEHWLTPRSELVNAKGKGELQTFWVNPQHHRKVSIEKRLVEHLHKIKEDSNGLGVDSVASDSGSWGHLSVDDPYPNETEGGKKLRLIEWNTEVLVALLGRLGAKRQTGGPAQMAEGSSTLRNLQLYLSAKGIHSDVERTMTELSCVKTQTNVLDVGTAQIFNILQSSDLDSRVRKELQDYVAEIAGLYNALPFHNFEHASHVTLSSVKLLNRIVMAVPGNSSHLSTEEHHAATFGIASDPLVHFVIVLSALVHDVGHPGLSNDELVASNHKLSKEYGPRSVAELHSIDLALKTLDKYQELQRHIYRTPQERDRFHELLRRSVLATDIMASDSVWHWPNGSGANISDNIDANAFLDQKASIALEQIIQASDVAHTMQHWHVYCKWNEKLFLERYAAFQRGDSKEDPGQNWYEGELSFFDKYVVPLASRLREYGIYGASSEEYYGFAIENRREWEMKGRVVVASLIRRAKQQFCDDTSEM